MINRETEADKENEERQASVKQWFRCRPSSSFGLLHTQSDREWMGNRNALSRLPSPSLACMGIAPYHLYRNLIYYY